LLGRWSIARYRWYDLLGSIIPDQTGDGIDHDAVSEELLER
jgi:hypothetical protein